MRICKTTFLELAFCILASILISRVLFRAYTLPIDIPPELKNAETIVYIVLWLLDAAFLLLFIVTLIDSPKFYEIRYIPISEFEIETYKNIHVWSYKGTAWVYGYDRDKKFNRDQIKTIHYYGWKKQFLKWKIVGEEQIIKQQ